MSGICAVWRTQSAGRAADMLAVMCSGLAFSVEEPVKQENGQEAGVGLSARFDTQQIYSNPQVLIACDAELYNLDDVHGWANLREEAPAAAKTAALLAGMYARYGIEFVEKLRGDFSIVLWDRRERKLFAAVDGMGIKRLVYYQDRNALLVASRIEALLSAGAKRDINPRSVANVLNFGASLAPKTIFEGVQRLLPGTFLLASDGQTRTGKYWDMRYGTGTDFNEDRLSQELESVVERSVAAHCQGVSFDRLGAFLSGGTDSSTVVGMMGRAGQSQPNTFSIGFQEQPFNELGYAEIAAKKFQANHHTYLVGPGDCFEALPKMIRSFDEPFGNSSAIPTYFCARLAAQHGIKALLAGDGGDELFGGNDWYATDKIFQLYQTLPGVLRKGLIEPALSIVPFQNGLVGKARRYVRRSNLPVLERVMSYHFLCAHAPAEVFEDGFLESIEGYQILETPSRYFRQAPANEDLDRLLYMDVKIVLGDSDLPKVTCMSELVGIQARFPFLDRSVAEFSGRIPARLKVKGFQKRYLFKKAFRELLPAEIIQKKKHGFGIPVATWLKSDPRMRELGRDTLLSTRALERGYFKRRFIEDLFQKHETDDSTYYGDTLWTFLVLELWHRQAVDEPARVAV